MRIKLLIMTDVYKRQVIKPATAMNKETSLTVVVPGATLFVDKTLSLIHI